MSRSIRSCSSWRTIARASSVAAAHRSRERSDEGLRRHGPDDPAARRRCLRAGASRPWATTASRSRRPFTTVSRSRCSRSNTPNASSCAPASSWPSCAAPCSRRIRHGTSRPCRTAASNSASARRSSRTSRAATRCRGASPVARMGDYIDALRAIFTTFATGAPLRFEGEHYQFTRMQPYFNPGPIAPPPPPLWLGGVNPKICRLAGREGRRVHHASDQLEPSLPAEIALPNLTAGAEAVPRDPRRSQLVVGSPYITGATPAAVAVEREHQRTMLAFLYSTPRIPSHTRALRLGRARRALATHDARGPMGRTRHTRHRRGSRRIGATGHLRRTSRRDRSLVRPHRHRCAHRAAAQSRRRRGRRGARACRPRHLTAQSAPFWQRTSDISDV